MDQKKEKKESGDDSDDDDDDDDDEFYDAPESLCEPDDSVKGTNTEGSEESTPKSDQPNVVEEYEPDDIVNGTNTEGSKESTPKSDQPNVVEEYEPDDIVNGTNTEGSEESTPKSDQPNVVEEPELTHDSDDADKDYHGRKNVCEPDDLIKGTNTVDTTPKSEKTNVLEEIPSSSVNQQEVHDDDKLSTSKSKSTLGASENQTRPQCDSVINPLVTQGCVIHEKVEKKFMVFVPTAATLFGLINANITSVIMTSQSAKELNAVLLNCHNEGNNLYEVTINLPMDYDEKWTYRYKAAYSYNRCKFSQQFVLGKHTVNRDCWKNYIPYSMYAHLNDLVLHCPLSTNETQRQIERVCKVNKLKHEVANRVIESIIEQRKNLEDFAFPFTVVVGNIFSVDKITSTTLMNSNLDANMAMAFLTQLLQMKETYLPTRAKYVCNIYCEIALSESYNLKEQYVHICEAFVRLCYNPSHTLFQQLTGSVVKCKLSTNLSKEAPIFKSVATICRCLSDSHNTFQYDLKHFLQTVTYFVSIEGILDIRRDILSDKNEVTCSNHQIVLDILYSIVRKRIQTELNRIKDNLGFENIVVLWQQIKDIPSLRELEKEIFENKLVEMLKSAYLQKKRILANIFRDMCIKHSFFETERCQKKLIDATLKSNYLNIRMLFATFPFNTKLGDDVYDQLTNETYENLFKTTLDMAQNQTTSNSAKIVLIFQILCDIMSLKAVQNRPDLQQILANMASTKLKQYSFETVLGQAVYLETLSEQTENARTMFTHQLQMLIEDECAKGQKPVELLKKIDAQTKQCSMKETLRESIIGTFLDTCCGFPDKGSSCKDLFVFMMRNHAVWNYVFETSKHDLSVKKNKTYATASDCVMNFVTKFRNGDIEECYIRDLAVRVKQTKQLLAHGECTLTELDELWTQTEKHFKNNFMKMKNVENVLTKVASRLENISPEFGLSAAIASLNNRVKQVRTEMEAMHVTKSQTIWGDISRLPILCHLIEKTVTSQVFWNACSTDVYNTTIERRKHSNSNSNDDEDNNQTYVEIMSFLETLAKTGNYLYKDAWGRIQTNNSLKMTTVWKIFSKADIKKEIEIAQKYFESPIEISTKDALERISEIEDVKDSVDAMKSALDVFHIYLTNDSSFHEAVSSFEKLVKETSTDLQFSFVKSSLQTVFKIRRDLSDISIDVLKSLGNGSLLIDFLKDIVDEDIRNLLDAVEDISEHHVSESTVSSLIDVKRYLHPLLLSTFDQKGQQLFQIVEDQTKVSGENVCTLPAKIEECMANLHNLKSLYRNVANRGEHTKEMIENISKSGEFHFRLKKKSCGFTTVYCQDTNKREQSEVTLVDLRSRALLLVNSEKKGEGEERQLKTHILSQFVDYIDLCLEISETIYMLHTSGHIRYNIYNETIELSNLRNVKSRLKNELSIWESNLESKRASHYLMNFVHGTQIHFLYDYLENNHSGYCKDVDILLQYIHPKMKSENLKKCYLQEKGKKKVANSDLDDKDLLECLGSALHSSFNGLRALTRPVDIMNAFEKTKMTVEENEQLMLIRLGESSLHVVRTVLGMYTILTQKLPEANQLLFCTNETSWYELELLINRCCGSNAFYGSRSLFCIANVELLPNEVQFKLVDALHDTRNKSDILLALVCRGSKHHPFVDELRDCVKTVQALSDKEVKDILEAECPSVCTITSEVAGQGKSNSIYQMAHKIEKRVVTLHISGPMHKRHLVERLRNLKLDNHCVLHLDIGSVDNFVELDTFLFELIILKHVNAGTISFSLQCQRISIEIANTLNDTLRNSLQTAVSFKRRILKWNGYNDFVISHDIQSPVQVVCCFLFHLEKGLLDTKDLTFTGKDKVTPLSSKQCRNLLKKHLRMNTDMSFSIVHTFLNVLSDQLKKMSCSTFFKTSRIKDMIGHKVPSVVRSSLLVALIEVCKEFAYRSVQACRSTQLSTLTSEYDEATGKVMLYDKRIQGGMIRWQDSNHLMYVFHNQNVQTVTPIYRDKSKVPVEIKTLFEGQMKRKIQDFSRMSQSELQNILIKIVRTKPIQIASTHITISKAQTTFQNIICSTAHDHTKEEIEALSSYALTPDNLLKMVLIILRIKANVPVLVMGETGCGKTSLIRYLAFICHVPFRVLNIHAGLEEKAIVKAVMDNNKLALEDQHAERWLFLDEINTCEYIGFIADIICHHKCRGELLAPNLVITGACNPYKLRSKHAISTAGLKGKIKSDELSRFVYRVLPLPEMLVDYVWDFGSLSEEDEELYIKTMVEEVFPRSNNEHDLYSDTLIASQRFVRKHQKTSYNVSLRDVQRCKTLTVFFLSFLKEKDQFAENKKRTDHVTERAIILALALCYYSRFFEKSVRKEFRQTMEDVFQKHGKRLFREERIDDVINREQKDILDRMELPPGTAKNNALQENVFVILVCILNRIPIFVVGKPGCSKSLAMQIIRSNLRGKDSKNPFFKTRQQLYCVSFQGSESSTSDGIIKVFEKAGKYQNSSGEDVLSVVILDEIGLAEISRFNPLKVLHNLLEPDGKNRPNIAVVGISNWSLDASKMNRGIHLSRPDMDVDELFKTGFSIGESFELGTNITQFTLNRSFDTFRAEDIKKELSAIAESYHLYTESIRITNFHGLRDYYSLVKFIAREVSETKKKQLPCDIADIIFKGIARNFGGLPTERETLLKCFHMRIGYSERNNINVVDLIKSNIEDQLARHLMLITSGEAVLGIVEEQLEEMGRCRREVIIGSQFEEDLTDDYNYRILSRIILCMEQGLILILKGLENVYGSLYDMLNQNYTMIGKKKNCRIALGPYSNPICRVSDSFRCIVLVDKSNIDHTDPPFLNRFEKQCLTFSDILCEEHKDIIQSLDKWIHGLKTIQGVDFTPDDCFPNYSENMVASLVLNIQKHMSGTLARTDNRRFEEQCKNELLWIVKPEVIVRLRRSNNGDIRKDSKSIKEQYYELPIHEGIQGLMKYQLEPKPERAEMTIVFTNSNVHSNISQGMDNQSVQFNTLGTFKSEKQLSTRMQQFWLETCEANILFVQCSAVEDEKHIMLAKSLIEKFRLEFLSQTPKQLKHVYLIVHLDRNKGSSRVISQINFLSDWKLVMLDCLESPDIPLPELCSLTLDQIIERKRPLAQYIAAHLFWTFTRIKYTSEARTVENIRNILEQMKTSFEFLSMLDDQVCSCIRSSHKDIHGMEWQVQTACDKQALHTSVHLLDAMERYIKRVINVPLAKVMYQIENMNILDSFFLDDENSVQRRQAWKSMFENRDIFSIDEDTNEPGPEAFVLNREEIPLRMPFSNFLFDQIETTKEEYLLSLTLLKGKCDLDEDDALPHDIHNELLLNHRSLIMQNIPDLILFQYDNWTDDYIEDFCNIVSYKTCSGIQTKKRVEYMRWAIAQKVEFSKTDTSKLFVQLHTAFWTHSAMFIKEMQLLEICKDVIEDNGEDLMLLVRKTYETLTYVSDTNTFQHNDTTDIEEELKVTTNNEDLNIVVTNDEHTSTTSGTNDCQHNDTTDIEEDSKVTKSNEDLNIIVTNDEHTSTTSGTDDCQHNDTTDIEDDSKVTRSNEDLNIIVTNDEHINTTSGTDDCQHNDTTDIEEDSRLTTSYAEKKEHSSSKSFDDTDENTKENDKSIIMQNNGTVQITDQTNDTTFTEHDVLVDIICKKMLPTTATLKRYDNTATWQVKVNSVLTLAVNISQEPQSVHALKLCNDIAAGLIIPYNIDDNILQIIGNKLQHQVLDTDAIFELLMKMIKSAPDNAQLGCQRLLSTYFIRCLSSNPQSAALTHLLTLILKSQFPDKSLEFLKSPVYLALSLEVDEREDDNMNVYLNLLKDPSHDKLHAEQYKESIFLKQLDQCLQTLLNKDDLTFATLIVDILQELYTNLIDEIGEAGIPAEKKDELESNFRRCQTILKELRLGLQYVAAIAYSKAFISVVTGTMDRTVSNTDSSKIVIYSVLNNIEDKDGKIILLNFFMKTVATNMEICRFAQWCDQSKGVLPVLQTMQWTPKDSYECFEGCPLNIHIPNNIKKCRSINASQFTTWIKGLWKSLAAVSNENRVLTMFSIAMQHFYLPKRHEPIDDSRKIIAIELDKETACMTEQQSALLKCLFGINDFKMRKFILTEGLTSTQICVSTFLTSLYGLILASKSNRSIFAKCISKPSEVLKCYLPGFPDSKMNCFESTLKKAVSYATCKCGHRFAVTQERVENYNCIICKQHLELHPIQHEEMMTHVVTQTGFVMSSEMKELTFEVRNLSAVTCNILYILTKGCLLGSFSLGLDSVETIANVTSFPKTDATHILWEDIECHWKNIACQLNLTTNDVAIFLHCVLRQAKVKLCENTNLLCLAARAKWEYEFDHIVKGIVADRYKHMHDLLCEHIKANDLSENIAKQYRYIHELDFHTSDTSIDVKTLFRCRGMPTMEHFMYELRQQSDQFPFLSMFLKRRKTIELSIHMFAILQWHIAAVSNVNYMMKKQECLNMTALDFLEKGGDNKERIKTRFNDFQRSWSKLKENDLFVKYKDISQETKMKECLILGKDSDVYQVLNCLVEIQNNFLDMALGIAQSCTAVYFLSREQNVSVIPCIPASAVTKQNLIEVDFAWDSILLQESQCDLSYGKGMHVVYDFQVIEKELAVKVLLGRTYIVLENKLPEVVFSDEIYKNYVSLAKEIKATVQQTCLTDEVKNGVIEKQNEDQRMTTELLTHLGVIMTLLKKTKTDDSQTPLMQYADDWKHILTRPFPIGYLPDPPSSVKLCHTVALYELLEELNSDSVIKSLESQFRVPLEKDLSNHFKTMTKNNHKMAELILRAIRRYAHRCLSIRDPVTKQGELEQPLRAVLSDDSFWPDDSKQNDNILVDGTENQIADILPKNILVRHIDATVTCITTELDKLRRGRMLHVTFNQQTNNPVQIATRKKKRATHHRAT